MRRTTWAMPVALAVLGTLPGLRAQQPDPEAMQKKLDAKLAEPWVELGGWITDFDAAKARAKKENKLVFAYFSRSYSP